MGSARARPHTINLGGLELFYLDTGGEAPPVLMLHGLSANAHSFGGIIGAQDNNAFRFIAPDLRGRARSGKPVTGYELGDHARDVIALMDALNVQSVMLVGHSFGGYLATYIAATFPTRVSKLVILDAAISAHPRIGVLLKPSLDRLTHIAASAEEYLAEIRSAPYLHQMWDDTIEAYFRAELMENSNGTAQSATSAAAIAQSSYGIAIEPLLHHVQQVRQPTLLYNAVGEFGPPGTPPLFDEVTARATARAFPNARYEVVPGNHITLLFGDGAVTIRRGIESFYAETSA